MKQHERSFTHRGMLTRPRVHDLIREGLEHPLLLMLAGPGYGKTQSMSSYLASGSADILWVRFSALDNLPIHFWNHLLRAMKEGYAELAQDLQQVEFPDSLSGFDAFETILAKHISRQKQTVWVFDDFGNITDHRILNFSRTIVDAQIPNFHMVLMSNALNNSDSLAFMSSKRFLITGKDLRFTSDEIIQLYALYDIALTADEIKALDRYTEGWPLPLHLLVLQGEKKTNLPTQGREMTHRMIADLFESSFFSGYTTELRLLIVKLSLLTSFTRDFARGLHSGKQDSFAILDSHPFLIYEPVEDRFYFHQLYRTFLQQKRYLISREEERALYRKAAEYYISIGETMEAVACCRKCGDNIGVLNAIQEYIRMENDITPENASFFLENLALLTPEEEAANPVVEHLRAIISLNLLQFEKAETILQRQIAKLLAGEDTVQSRALLGEAYAVMGSIHMLNNQEDFGKYYEKAVYYLPSGSNFHNRNQMSTRNNHIFVMADNQPGARERIEKAMHQGIPWINKFLRGSMSGKEFLFSAEAAYLCFEPEAAQQHAYRAIYKAKAHAQHDLVCNSYAILMRTGLLLGDYAEMTKHLQDAVQYAEACNIGVMREIRDTILAWYYVKLHDAAKMPRSIFTMNDESKPIWTYGRSQLVYANYLLHTKEFARLVGMLETPRGMMLMQGITPDRIALHTMLAIGYCCLGNLDAAVDALWKAYDMAHHNGLITPFIECERYLLELFGKMRPQDRARFDAQWLEEVSAQTEAFAKRAAEVRAAYQKQNPAKTAKDNPLTKREREVLQALAQGLTREEISHSQYVSVNTVKSTIGNIYNKLNANNRAEAVSIAITKGYIDGYSAT